MKAIEKAVIGLVQDYAKRHNRYPSSARMAKATADEWFGVDLDEQAVESRVDGKVLRIVFDNSMPKGEVEVV